MGQEQNGKSRGFHFEVNSIEDFATLFVIIRGETNTAANQAQIDALTRKLNQSSTPLAEAMNQQKDK